MSYWYNWFSWWWARGCLKHAENRNKHTWKRIVHQVGYLQRLYRDARSSEHEINPHLVITRLLPAVTWWQNDSHVHISGTSLYLLHRGVHFKEGHKPSLPLLRAKVQFNVLCWVGSSDTFCENGDELLRPVTAQISYTLTSHKIAASVV
jgi:hypothetical protein